MKIIEHLQFLQNIIRLDLVFSSLTSFLCEDFSYSIVRNLVLLDLLVHLCAAMFVQFALLIQLAAIFTTFVLEAVPQETLRTILHGLTVGLNSFHLHHLLVLTSTTFILQFTCSSFPLHFIMPAMMRNFYTRDVAWNSRRTSFTCGKFTFGSGFSPCFLLSLGWIQGLSLTSN